MKGDMISRILRWRDGKTIRKNPIIEKFRFVDKIELLTIFFGKKCLHYQQKLLKDFLKMFF